MTRPSPVINRTSAHDTPGEPWADLLVIMEAEGA
jgi:hypothetical protein